MDADGRVILDADGKYAKTGGQIAKFAMEIVWFAQLSK